MHILTHIMLKYLLLVISLLLMFLNLKITKEVRLCCNCSTSSRWLIAVNDDSPADAWPQALTLYLLPLASLQKYQETHSFLSTDLRCSTS